MKTGHLGMLLQTINMNRKNKEIQHLADQILLEIDISHSHPGENIKPPAGQTATT